MDSVRIRFLLDGFASAFHVCETETQRRRVVEHAIKVMAQFTPEQQIRTSGQDTKKAPGRVSSAGAGGSQTGVET
jgi:hypothetical protein